MSEPDTKPGDREIHPLVVSLLGPKEQMRILFVDDDDLILRAFARDMNDTDIELTLARSGREGLKALPQKKFNIVIADFQMPGMDGISFLEEVANLSPDSVRILISGRADFNMAIDVINRVGLFNFIPKPWEPYALRDIIRRAMEHHAITLENRRLSSLLGDKCDELSHLARQLEHDVQKRTSHLLFGLVSALDLRDTDTQWHSRRVSAYAKRLAEALGLEGKKLLAVERGALLHDVGKIGISDTILLKPGKLTEEEWVLMRKHPEYGYHILKAIEFLGDARLLVWEHHERWDGRGYPKGLKGEEIYIGARIFAVIDTYDSMTSDRPYRKAMPHEAACREITERSGSQFDPEVVTAWQGIPKEEIFAIRAQISNGENQVY